MPIDPPKTLSLREPLSPPPDEHRDKSKVNKEGQELEQKGEVEDKQAEVEAIKH